MIKIYGSMLCPDCVQCRQELDEAGTSYEYLDFSADLKNLKEFLKLLPDDLWKERYCIVIATIFLPR